MFSFLTGKKDSAGPAEPDVPVEPVAPVEPVVPVVTDAAHSAGADSPFSPPPAWNIDALTAPPPAAASGAPEIGPADPALTAEYQQKIIDVIKTVYDPEIPVDIYELGLVYEIIVDANHRALIKMTLTSPACPSAQQIPQEVRYKVKAVPGITDAWVEIVWEPTWTKDLMSEAAKLTLGFF